MNVFDFLNVFELNIIITLQNNIFSGLFVGQNLLTLKEVDSTNNFLKNLLTNSKPVPEGTVIMAESQFAGRGQQENKWHSEPGKNLTFSVLLNPAFLGVLNQFDLTRAISLGVYDALEPILGAQLKIKWPNDIYYADKKLGGMLIENLIQGGQIKNSIVGIGINVNQQDFPAGTGNPTSIRQILHEDYDLRTLLSEICTHIEAYYLNLKAGKIVFLRNAYLNRLYWLNEPQKFKAQNEVFAGTIINVKETGLLVIKNNNNEEREFSLKEIEFLNK
ncbi:MAG: biotin--acetyl-CoA-carboxylase ligase [Mucilaginibacter sp.]|nr:biotin--acetyl-CoA-carboxylase ligase [Mucilaginibacter sp.]